MNTDSQASDGGASQGRDNCGRKGDADWLLGLDSEPLPPSHYPHLALIVPFPSMLSVKLRAREDARNEDYPLSDRAVIRKKKKERERVPTELVIRKGHTLRETGSNRKCLAGLGRSLP